MAEINIQAASAGSVTLSNYIILAPASTGTFVKAPLSDVKTALGIDQVFSAAEKTKLTGIATGATVNDTDANLKNRANHTGQQALSTLSASGATNGQVATYNGANWVPLTPSGGGTTIPQGNTASRPASPGSANSLRYNTQTFLMEYWDGTQWTSLRPYTPPPLPGLASLSFPNYITASGRTSQTTEILNFATELDNSGVSQYIVAMYLLEGQTALKNKFNMFDALDLDSAFRMVFSGGVIHASTGLNLNGAGIGDSMVDPSLIAGWPNVGFGAYYQSAPPTTSTIIANAANTSFSPYEGGMAYFNAGATSISGVAISGGAKAGFNYGQRLNVAGVQKLQTYYNGVFKNEETTVALASPGGTLKLDQFNNGTASVPMTMFVITKAMPPASVSYLNTAIDDFMTSIGRYVNP